MIYMVLAALHIAACVLILLGMLRGILRLPKYMFFIALLLPFWGEVLVLVLHFEIAFDPDDAIDLTVDEHDEESEIYRSVTVDEKRSVSTVPIEEALLINSAREKRSIIMDVLNDNPREYVEFLQKAGDNDDTEVVHYAVTAMVEISKENDYVLQRLEAEHMAKPDDIDVLTEYSDFLWGCLSQKLMQGQVEVMNRELFSQLMQKKLVINEDIHDYSRLAENEMKRKNIDGAGEIIAKMKEKWPHSEEYILLRIQYLAELNKGAEIAEFIQEISNSHIYLSSKTKEALAFWAE